MPMISAAGGGEKYAMNPTLGAAIEKARGADVEKQNQAQATSLLFERADDGSSIKCTVTRDGGAPEVRELSSVDDAKDLLDQEFGDEGEDSDQGGDQVDNDGAKNAPPSSGGSQL